MIGQETAVRVARFLEVGFWIVTGVLWLCIGLLLVSGETELMAQLVTTNMGLTVMCVVAFKELRKRPVPAWMYVTLWVFLIAAAIVPWYRSWAESRGLRARVDACIERADPGACEDARTACEYIRIRGKEQPAECVRLQAGTLDRD